MKAFLYSFLYYLCSVESKRKQALLGSNLSGIDLTCTNCREKGLAFSTILLYNLVAICLKKPNIVLLVVTRKKVNIFQDKTAACKLEMNKRQ